METEAERTRKAPILPPDYVSLAQLRERWLQKQQQNAKDEQNASLKNQETGLTVETPQNQVEDNKKKNNNKKKKWKKNKKKKLPFIDEKDQNQEFLSEIDKKSEGERLEIVPKKPIGETSGVNQNNGNNGVANGTIVHRVKLVDETKGKNGYKKWQNRKRVGSNNRFGNSVAGIHDSKGDEKLKELDEMSKSEVGVKLGSLKVNGPRGKGLNNENLVENGAKDDGKVEARKEFGRYWNRSGKGGRKNGRHQDFGDRRLGNKRTVGGGNRLEKSEAEIHEESSRGGEKGKDLEEMSNGEVVEVSLKLDGLKVKNSDGSQGKDGSVVGVVLKDDQIAEIENRAKDDEKGETGNRSGNVGRMFGRAAYSHRRSSNAVGNRNYGSSGRLGGGRMNQRDNVKVWVKKEDKLGANAARVGFTGI